MSPVFYHIAHLVGLMFLFAGFGGLLSAGNRGRAMMMHGIGLLIMLVSGFGLIAKTGLSYTTHWVIGMYVIWLLLGGLPVLGKRGILPVGAVVAIALVLGCAAAYLGFTRPTF